MSARNNGGDDMHRLLRTCVALLGSAAIAAELLAPGEGAATKSGPIQFYVSGSTVTTPILVTGVVTDYGKATSVTKAGKPDENGNFEKIVLKKGGFWVDATQLNKLLNNVRPTIDKANCFFAFKGSGPTKVFKGSGAYAGITGTVNVNLNFVGIGSRLPNGKCNMA